MKNIKKSFGDLEVIKDISLSVFGDAAKFNDGWLFRLTDDSAIVRTDYVYYLNRYVPSYLYTQTDN